MPGSLPFPTAALPASDPSAAAAPFGAFCRHGLRFCGLRREDLSLRSLNWAASGRITPDSSRRFSNKILAVVKDNRSPAKVFDYDLVIIGAGVGGHGAAIHAVEKIAKGLGCVPSKALLAVSGRMHELHDENHLKALGLQVKSPGYDRQSVADHANNLPSKIQSNLTNSLTALGVDILTGVGTILVTFVEALDQLMPGFDPEIGKLAQRILINPRKIDYHADVFAKKVDAALIATGRAPFTKGLGLENINVDTIRDANGKLMLAHVASAQGISVVEQICGNDNVLNHLSIPAAYFTHSEISMVGLIEPQAMEKAEKDGFEIRVAKTSFKANTKALAENEGEGLAKLIYRPDTEEILGVHILGLHAADLIHEASNAIALGTHLQDIKFALQGHPTLSEVLDELFKSAK
ncbi:hypothetical protein OPV22_009409 [Ensete ventricosum]|uniref:Pyridine nucleotide-disulphide oxidoreductase dimerisation domain-containing protein n=1 Tax=Ensete ventricosum TaxID=4639 RepID=A0AAV8RJ29_ENSVE|nr:hypothetical protein OPV22_009409 [Ensete ventricosum]